MEKLDDEASKAQLEATKVDEPFCSTKRLREANEG